MTFFKKFIFHFFHLAIIAGFTASFLMYAGHYLMIQRLIIFVIIN